MNLDTEDGKTPTFFNADEAAQWYAEKRIREAPLRIESLLHEVSEEVSSLRNEVKRLKDESENLATHNARICTSFESSANRSTKDIEKLGASMREGDQTIYDEIRDLSKVLERQSESLESLKNNLLATNLNLLQINENLQTIWNLVAVSILVTVVAIIATHFGFFGWIQRTLGF